MTGEEGREHSPFVDIYEELRRMQPKWNVVIGHPPESGWITGTDLQTATEGPFHALLSRIGEKAGTTDRKTIAASFAF